MKHIFRLITLLGLVFFNACADYQIHLSRDVQNWEHSPLPSQKVVHKLYLIGDAGGAEYNKGLPAVELLKNKLGQEEDPKEVTVVFLGDNIYWNGMPSDKDPSKAEERQLDEYKLKVQMDAVKKFDGRVHFIAGNHDWYKYGVDGVEEQEAFLDDYLDRDDVMEPNPGCGDPAEIELRKDLVLVLLDSQWFLQNWAGEPEINEGCEVKSRSVFALQFEEMLKGNRNKNVVIAMHHPVYTFGPHGGGFTFREHVFPLTALNKNLWIPLPLAGSIYPFFRSAIGTSQDLAHPKYREFRDIILNAARKNGNFIFASGHEHSMQYIERGGQSFIVSGSGSKKSATRLGEGSDFSYGEEGISELLVYEDGSVWVQFWAAAGNGQNGQLVFRKKIKAALPKAKEIYEDSLTALFSIDPDKELVTVPMTDRDYSKKGLGKKIWGVHYREAYVQDITVPQLNLNEFKGGVQPVKRGGGYQTNSLRLETEEEKQYTMRSVKKDATRTVPYPLNQTFILDVVKDNFSAAHPLAANVIPPMADAIGIYHTNPQLYYVPKQPALDFFNENYGDALYLVEERPDEKVWKEADFFGRPDNILSTADMLEDVLDDHDHQIDTRFVVRNRLFDVLIGDWDRHDDQWRWAEFEDGKEHTYRPIPRDRDQAFSRYDGWLIGTLRRFSPALQPLRDYGKKPVKWTNYGARYFDPTFLSEAEWEDWEAEARHIQEKLTDEVIESSFQENWPAKFVELDGVFIMAQLKKRRDNLLDIARQMYEENARNVEVLGTSDRELVEVERKQGNQTSVRMYALSKKGNKQELLYERTFLAGETKEVSVFGKDDDDVFKVYGSTGKGPLVRLIGGDGQDEFYDESKVGGGKKTVVYDILSEDRVLEKGRETRLKLTDDPFYNLHNRKDKHYEMDYGFFLPTLSANPDDGLLLGGMASFFHYGYKKEPYAGSHNLNLQYAAGTDGFRFTYDGSFIDVFGSWDVQLNALVRTPLYTSNFYGLGNETINTELENGVDFHRVRQREYSLFAAVMRRQYSSFLAIGPEFEGIAIDRTAGRFIDVVGDELNPEIFDEVRFLGLKMVFDYRNVDNAAYPSRGVGFVVRGGWKMELEDANRNFPYLEAALSIYQRLDRKGILVLATRVGGKQVFNNKFEFFQGAMLGGIGPNSNMRGFRRDRFVGQSSFYHNTDLRMQLFVSQNRAVPFVLGAFGGFDYGRVWLEDDGSDLWHTSAGGGLFISPFNVATVSFGIFKGGDAQARFMFGGGFFF
jgi:hypothetical protein